MEPAALDVYPEGMPKMLPKRDSGGGLDSKTANELMLLERLTYDGGLSSKPTAEHRFDTSSTRIEGKMCGGAASSAHASDDIQPDCSSMTHRHFDGQPVNMDAASHRAAVMNVASRGARQGAALDRSMISGRAGLGSICVPNTPSYNILVAFQNGIRSWMADQDTDPDPDVLSSHEYRRAKKVDTRPKVRARKPPPSPMFFVFPEMGLLRFNSLFHSLHACALQTSRFPVY
jgi:hypothetical protein